MKKKRLMVAGVLVLLFAYWIYSINDSANMSKTKVSWVSDINQLEETLSKESTSAFRNISKKEFHKRLQQLIKETSKLSDDDIRVRLTEIVESLKDDNTHVIYKNSALKKTFPLYILKEKDKYIVKAVGNEYSNLLDSELIKINDKALKDIENTYKSAIPNIYKDGQNANEFFVNPDSLRFIKVIQGEQARFTFKKNNGEIKSLDFKADHMQNGSAMASSFMKQPDIRSTKPVFNNVGKNVWCSYIEQHKVLYCMCNFFSVAQYKILEDIPDAKTMEVYKDMDIYSDKNAKYDLESIMVEAKNRNYEKLVIDLRFSQMPHPKIMKELTEKIESIKPTNKNVKIYIIMPNSNTTNMIPYLQKLKASGKYIFYGAKNVTYQDYENETIVKLKNSKVGVLYSKEKDLKKLNSVFKPDYLIKVNEEDYSNGNDPIYDAIVKHN